jgi:hypothetical protein
MRSRTYGNGSAPFWCVPTARREDGNPPPICSWHARDHVPPVRVVSQEGHVHTGTLHLELRVAVTWRRPRFSGEHTARGRRLPHTTDQGGTAVDRDHTPPQAGLRVPDPLFTTTIPAGRRSSCPPPLPPGGQPDHHSSTGSGTNSPQEQQKGRHRRAWLSWLWPQFPPAPVQKVTLEDLRRWLSHERSYTPQPRRIVVLPRQRFTPDADAPVTGTGLSG